MKITNIVLSVLFFVFAIVQWNDVDPWMWIGLYSFVGVVSAFAAVGKYNKASLIVGIILCIIGLGILLPGFIDWVNKGMPTIVESMKAEAPHIELTREFLGLFIVLAALIFHLRRANRLQKTQ
ncbi:MAG: transmembrane 220 family protein [Bacteroidota bacterium]